MISSFILISLLALAGCLEQEPPPSQNFVNPDKVCTLPKELFEISGLTDVDGKTVAGVHDESGSIYYYDLENCSIKNKVEFAGSGDFEGLTRVDNTFYVLRSDGTLFEIVTQTNGKPKVTETKTNVPAGDNEGLAYDPKMNRLLIAPKAKYRDKSFEKEYRAVYGYDLATNKIMKEPVVRVSVKEAGEFISEKAGQELPKKKKSNKSHFRFDISSITVHPVKDQYYLLINSARMVLITDRDGKVVDALPLDKKIFPQPEGITFLGNNKLVISSEGANGKPAIGIFNQ